MKSEQKRLEFSDAIKITRICVPKGGEEENV